MTTDTMALQALLEKRDVAPDFLRETLAFMLQELMVHEVSGLCGAERHARSEARVNQRNGYRERPLETRLGRKPETATCCPTASARRTLC